MPSTFRRKKNNTIQRDRTEYQRELMKIMMEKERCLLSKADFKEVLKRGYTDKQIVQERIVPYHFWGEEDIKIEDEPFGRERPHLKEVMSKIEYINE